MVVRILIAAALAFALAGFAVASAPAPAFHADCDPERLSGRGMVTLGHGRLFVGDRVAAYTLNTPLFTDYPQKLRTVWLPEGQSAPYKVPRTKCPVQSAPYADDGPFDFPVGAVITKTFYSPRANRRSNLPQSLPEALAPQADGFALAGLRLIEAPILVRRETGWRAAVYVWNDTTSRRGSDSSARARAKTAPEPHADP